jgi:hypothetical protein
MDYLKISKDVFFSEETFYVESLVEKVKLLFWKWFLGKNPGSPVPFTSEVFTLLYAGTGRVCLGVMLGLDESGRLDVLLLLCPPCS